MALHPAGPHPSHQQAKREIARHVGNNLQLVVRDDTHDEANKDRDARQQFQHEVPKTFTKDLGAEHVTDSPVMPSTDTSKYQRTQTKLLAALGENDPSNPLNVTIVLLKDPPEGKTKDDATWPLGLHSLHTAEARSSRAVAAMQERVDSPRHVVFPCDCLVTKTAAHNMSAKEAATGSAAVNMLIATALRRPDVTSVTAVICDGTFASLHLQQYTLPDRLHGGGTPGPVIYKSLQGRYMTHRHDTLIPAAAMASVAPRPVFRDGKPPKQHHLNRDDMFADGYNSADLGRRPFGIVMRPQVPGAGIKHLGLLLCPNLSGEMYAGAAKRAGVSGTNVEELLTARLVSMVRRAAVFTAGRAVNGLQPAAPQ
jgi:hypothetical protein